MKKKPIMLAVEPEMHAEIARAAKLDRRSMRAWVMEAIIAYLRNYAVSIDHPDFVPPGLRDQAIRDKLRND